MGRTDPPLVGNGRSGPRIHVDTEWKPGDVLVILRVRGEIDVDGSRTLDHCLRTRIPGESRYVVVDLDQVVLLGAPGVRVLIEQADRLALTGRRLLTVASSSHVRRVLGLMHATHLVNVHENVPMAIAACLGTPEPVGHVGRARTDMPGPPELGELRQEVFNLRAALRTRPVIARALGVVQERYGLRVPEAAFDLLRDSAQRHNLRLHALARALLDAPAPEGPVWFPGRTRRPAPSLSIFAQSARQRGNRSAVLSSFVDEVVKYVGAVMAAVQLVEPPGGRLSVESSRSLTPDLADHLAGEDDPMAPWRRAVAGKTRVVLENVSEEQCLPGRDVLLKAGVGTVVSTPLLTTDNSCVGVVTTCHVDTGFTPTRLQAAKLDHAATEIATWLDWHARTVVVDALEAVHHEATKPERRTEGV
ncbi:ANTAR domain-containing protein [Kibdelosporangium persicum]|uniref:Anti-anti-sigma factor n=1 Tax=Kibdelosporangium persicum TaxID=2698649 RepID=A0ABX2F1F5_9PSEU|nr:ANTAR domain-containing protein [Kibdelosporangium persicum]NRN65166.1 Anti-anti-sigma factor [Kibdelosporangium persicum]